MGRMSSPVSGKSAGWGSTEEALASEVVGYVVILGSGSACVGAFCMSREGVTPCPCESRSVTVTLRDILDLR